MFCLSTQGIIDTCDDILEKAALYDFYIHDFFKNMRLTGLRPVELQEFDRWTVLDENLLKVTAAKGSNDRIFQNSELTTTFVAAIRSGERIYDVCRLSTVRFWLWRWSSYKNLAKGNRQVSLYIFRYAKFKELHDLGWTTQQISDYMGERSNANTDGYINASLCTP